MTFRTLWLPLWGASPYPSLCPLGKELGGRAFLNDFLSVVLSSRPRVLLSSTNTYLETLDINVDVFIAGRWERVRTEAGDISRCRRWAVIGARYGGRTAGRLDSSPLAAEIFSNHFRRCLIASWWVIKIYLLYSVPLSVQTLAFRKSFAEYWTTLKIQR